MREKKPVRCLWEAKQVIGQFTAMVQRPNDVMIEIYVAFTLGQTATKPKDLVPLFPEGIVVCQDERFAHLVIAEVESHGHQHDGNGYHCRFLEDSRR
ncbi:hypothetical protein ES703_65746 [subsurface metagenome]